MGGNPLDAWLQAGFAQRGAVRRSGQSIRGRLANNADNRKKVPALSFVARTRGRNQVAIRRHTLEKLEEIAVR
jgi:hypothetical protein